MNMVLKILSALAVLPALVIGVSWVLMPAKAAEMLKMTLLEGEALGSQIGDGGVLFLSMAVMVYAGLFTGKRLLLQIPGLMFLAVALFRVIAHLGHGAGLTPEFVGIEIVSGVILLLTASRMDARA